MKKYETIKIFSVSYIKKVFQNCDDKFFCSNINFYLKLFRNFFCCYYINNVNEFGSGKFRKVPMYLL